MNESTHTVRGELIPLALRDAPALIEAVFPAQKVSFEAQRERKAGSGQTLTALGSYWKGRKPLILVRAILLGSLLPETDDVESDLEVFEMLMAFDDDGLARRALTQNALQPRQIAARIELHDPWNYFTHDIKPDNPRFDEVANLSFPLDCSDEGVSIRWRRDTTREDKLTLYRKALDTFPSYEEKSALGKRPEEVDQDWLYEPVWAVVNRHYAYLGIDAYSFSELIHQLGVLRYGHRPRVGDTFSGGGSIPFEAARLGCDVYASDLNPIACMLTWGALNIIGGPDDSREKLATDQRELVKRVLQEIDALGVENDGKGWHAKVFLYCVETTCPETGWTVPLLPSRIVSTSSKTIAELAADPANKRYRITIRSHVTADELKAAEQGTIWREGTYGEASLIHCINGKIYKTPLSTLRGDYRTSDGSTANRLRLWEKDDFIPRPQDLLQERLYCVQWMRPKKKGKGYDYEFRSVGPEDLERERAVEDFLRDRIEGWRKEGWLPDMEIEVGGPPRYQGLDLVKARGWTNWLHVFNARQLLTAGLVRSSLSANTSLDFASLLNCGSKLSRWHAARDYVAETFDNQALNTLYNYATQSFNYASRYFRDRYASVPFPHTHRDLLSQAASLVSKKNDIYITDPPYGDAVMYHEITDFFIAWLRKNPPPPFDKWTWDSRRALAIKGSGDDFRLGMVESYRAMTEQMPDNGMQCVMFTHQDTAVWSDMVGIFWAAGLQVVAAWYIATETTSELKKGGYVQGTVILMLRKRPAGERAGFKQRILPAVRTEVQRQIETMMNLNDEVKQKFGEPVFNDSDLQMAGYAAALKVLTSYTSIGDEDVTSFALRPRQRGEVTVVDEIVQQAAEAANSLLVPEGLGAETWARLSGIQRFYLRMMDMETTGASKLDNYQNFAKAFRVEDYARVMGNMAANKARLKRVAEFTSRELTESMEIGATWLGRLIIGLQQLLGEVEPQTVISQLQAEMPDFIEIRPLLIDTLAFIERKAPEPEVRHVAEVLGARLRNLRALGQ